MIMHSLKLGLKVADTHSTASNITVCSGLMVAIASIPTVKKKVWMLRMKKQKRTPYPVNIDSLRTTLSAQVSNDPPDRHDKLPTI